MKLTRRRKNQPADSVKEFDRLLTGGLIAVAAAAAALPWYVFLNPEKFGMTGRGWEALMHVPKRGGGGVDSFVAHLDRDVASNEATPDADAAVDAVTTATVTSRQGTDTDVESAVTQPFPGGTRFKLLHVSNGRALIEDQSGMFVVQIGSILPDESRLLSMTNVNGKWKIVTSAGESYSE